MIGAIIGDIVGSRFEFGSKPQMGFELFTDECSFTDDTICTIAIADAILNHKPYKDALLEWCHRYPNPMGGYGNGFYQWINSADPEPYNSCGNGSAMRVSPVGWLFNEYEEVISEARKSAECTHNHPEGIKGAQCVAEVILWGRHMRVAKENLEKKVKRFYGYEIPSLNDVFKIGSENHFDGVCQETVPMALRCLIESTNFEDAIRLAVMADGDTDTKADITGAMAEAYYEIPQNIAEKAFSYLPKDMKRILVQFFDAISEEI